MSKAKVTIDNIFDGISSTQYFGSKGSYNSALGVDPDFPIGNQVKTAGMLVPVVYEKFSGGSITGAPLWIITNTKESNVYVYTYDGKFVKYDETLTTETNLTAPTSGAGNGMAYYNNYIYLATQTDVARYGPMNGTPAIAQSAWTSAILGTQTALGNFTYPEIRGVKIPNHPMHVHGDDSLYFGDVVNGQGVIHRIHTKKVSVEGDTNDTLIPSLYNVLDLPIGYIPVDIESYGTDLVILAITTRDDSTNQGPAKLFFWDTIDDSFYNEVPISDPIATALLNFNGRLLIWSGNSQDGCRLSEYIGGDSISEIAYLEEGAPPFAGAVDALGSRIAWGAYTTYPSTSACVYAYGSKSSRLPRGLHNVIKTTSAGATPNTTALKFVQQASNKKPRMMVGWADGSAKGIDKLSSSATYSSVWRSKMFVIGREFNIMQISLRLGAELASNMSIVPKIIIDDLSTTITLRTINSTNYSGRRVLIKQGELNALSARGINNFILELNWAGTVECPVLLPIEITLQLYDDEKAL